MTWNHLLDTLLHKLLTFYAYFRFYYYRTRSSIVHIEMDAEWIEAIFRRNQKGNEVLKVLNVVTDDDSVPKGENYTSDIKRYKLELILASGRRTKKSFVCKVAQVDQKRVEALDELELFKTETKIYNHVFPPMESLMEEFDDNREKLWCNMYGYKPYNFIVLDDLKELGYKLIDRRDCLDLNHAQFFLRSLGRFHAMSRILIERGILSTGDLLPFYIEKMWGITETMISASLTLLSRIALEKWPAEWNDFGKRLQKLQPVILKMLQDLTVEEKSHESVLAVLNHGDLWTANMMFKHTEDGIPTSLKLIDFQVSHISSYIWDVIHFLYTSVKPEIRRSNIKDLLKIYWESLDTNLRRFGYTKYIPTLNDVFEEAERKDLFSFVTLVLFYPCQTADLDQGFDLRKGVEGADEAIDQNVYLLPKYLNECGNDFKYFLNKNIL